MLLATNAISNGLFTFQQTRLGDCSCYANRRRTSRDPRYDHPTFLAVRCLNPVDYGIWGLLKERIYCESWSGGTKTTGLDWWYERPLMTSRDPMTSQQSCQRRGSDESLVMYDANCYTVFIDWLTVRNTGHAVSYIHVLPMIRSGYRPVNSRHYF